MSNRVKVNLLKYGISSAIALALVYVYCSTRHVFLQPPVERWRILCDAFTIPGLTYVMFGFLMMIANEGFFDMLSYAASKAVGLFIPGAGLEKGETYYEYHQRKRENRATGFGFLFVVGGVCMALALLFMFLFYRLY